MKAALRINRSRTSARMNGRTSDSLETWVSDMTLSFDYGDQAAAAHDASAAAGGCGARDDGAGAGRVSRGGDAAAGACNAAGLRYSATRAAISGRTHTESM